MFDLDDCLATITNRAAKRIAGSLDREFDSYNITRVQWTALYYIDRYSELRQSELAALMTITEPTLVGILDRLEREGLVERRQSLEDRRQKYLLLTHKGRSLNQKMSPMVEKFKNSVTEGLTKAELETYKKVLDHMVKQAEKQNL